MNLRFRALVLAFLAAFCSSALVAAAQAAGAQQADFIVAIVNSEPITNSELRAEIARTSDRMVQQGQAVPAAEVLKSGVLERMIGERAQVQFGIETGIRIDQASVDEAERAVARQNQVEVAELHRNLLADGLTVASFRRQLRDQQILSRLRDRDVASQVRVSELDIDRYLLEQASANSDPFVQEINLAQILIAIPENLPAAQVPKLLEQAKNALARARSGEDFSALVQELSAAERSKGGELGLRRADRYPRSFVLVTQDLGIGGVSEIVRSGAGFHILKVIEKRAPTAVIRTVVQSHARHILFRPGPSLTQAAALARLAEFKKRILSGSATFTALAREFSQDSSAEDGGDLGWAPSGAFVPEFEETLNRLTDGDISDPVVSRFGVHLIQLIERRRVDLDPRQLRESVRNELRAIRLEEIYTTWAQDIRGRAFVDLRDAP